MIRLAVCLGVCASALCGCVLGPDYEKPDVPVAAAFDSAASLDPDLVAPGVTVEADWWRGYDDPVLSALIDDAAAGNVDLALAVSRIEQARLDRRLVSAATFPSVVFNGSGSRQQASETLGGLGPPPGAPSLQNVFSLGVDLSFEIDLFGRLKRREAAADLRIEASEEDRRAVMVAVFAEVGLAYARLRGLQTQYDVSGENVELARRTAELTRLMVAQDLAPELDLLRARADVSELEAGRNALLAGQRAAIARLALLTGKLPADITDDLSQPAPLPESTGRIPVGLPSTLLLRRPDIRAEERRLAAASEDIGAETADLFPSFRLTGGAGLGSANVEDLFDNASQTWNFGGVVRWPIFDGGRERIDIDRAELLYGTAGLEYRKAVLTAFSEVESALSSYVFLVKELNALETARNDRLRAYELADLRFRTGNDSLFPALEALRRLTGLKAEIAMKSQDVLDAQIMVYRSLGGGWQTYAPVETPLTSNSQNGR